MTDRRSTIAPIVCSSETVSAAQGTTMWRAAPRLPPTPDTVDAQVTRLVKSRLLGKTPAQRLHLLFEHRLDQCGSLDTSAFVQVVRCNTDVARRTHHGECAASGWGNHFLKNHRRCQTCARHCCPSLRLEDAITMAARPVQRRGTGRGIVRAHIQLLDDKRKPLDVLVKVPRPLPHVSSLQARTGPWANKRQHRN